MSLPITIPTLTELHQGATIASEVLGALFALCTAIGNPLSKFSSGRLSSFGHIVLAFGADIGKARKRIAELFGSSEKV